MDLPEPDPSDPAELAAEALQQAPVGFALLDDGLRYVFVNDALAAMNGLSPERHLGRTVRSVVPGVADAAEEVFLGVLRTGDPAWVDLSGPTAARVGDWAETVFALEGPSGDMYLGVLVSEVTDHKRFERAARQEAARAARTTAELQRALLPPAVLGTVDGIRLAGRYVPAAGDPVGGDWYGTTVLSDHRIAFSVGDVAGHGIRALQLMAECRLGFRALAQLDDGPGVLLSRLGRQMGRPGRSTMVTALCGVIDAHAMKFTIALAGHPPPLVRRADGKVATLDVHAQPPLGVGNSVEYREHTMRLLPGDTVVCFTDGLVETRDEGIDRSIERLGRLLSDHPVDDLEALCDALVGARSERWDDCALVAIRVRSPDGA